ncbi:MAG: eIF2A-related protein, partial [Blastocatellia bacterium]
THLLLVIDQFEELYTLCRDIDERNRFLDSLLEIVSAPSRRPDVNFKLLVTLRADFFGHALSYRPFADAFQHADLKLGPMTRLELQDAINKPAQKLNVQIEEGLTERLLSAVSQEPGNLPLLEFALTQLWSRPTNGKLTHAAYDAIGGVEQALADYAEEVYSRLSEAEQGQTEQLFVQLVRPGERTEDTRRRSTKDEVAEENWDLVTYLSDARLVVSGRDEITGEETVEVAHEALIRGWKRLRDWMESDREFRIWQERLRAALRQWETSRKDEGALLRGVLLAEAEKWIAQRPKAVQQGERAFIQASQERRDQEEQRMKALSKEAESQRQSAVSLQLAAQAELIRNQQPNLLERSVLLAVESMRRWPSLEASQTLLKGLFLLPRHRIARLAHEGPVLSVAFDP